MNMLCLYQARAIELIFGRLGFVVIYLLAGLGGGIASLIANPSNVVIAGASGAVFGVYGALGAKLVMHRAAAPPGHLAIRDVPAHLRPLFARLDELIAARVAAWPSLKAGVAESDPAKRAALFDAYKRKNDEIVLRGQAVTEEIERLER
jgi:hypothetical protein